jgi:16S rRNA (cytosine1402-N4)-methyltransferase
MLRKAFDASPGVAFPNHPVRSLESTATGWTAVCGDETIDAATVVLAAGGRCFKEAEERGELSTTADLRRACVRVLGPARGGIDPATRTFQALRIAVNEELSELDALLAALPHVLADDGVAVLISFHSLEDRAVKLALREAKDLSALTKKPVIAGDEESDANPRARSAKLRAARRNARGAS